MGLCATHTVSLAEAIEKAKNCRKLLREKIVVVKYFRTPI